LFFFNNEQLTAMPQNKLIHLARVHSSTASGIAFWGDKNKAVLAGHFAAAACLLSLARALFSPFL
jgi:hypothetical protein